VQKLVKEETKQISLFILFIIVSVAQILFYIWTVIFVRYGDHVKYNLDFVVTLQLGGALLCFFLTLIFGILAVWKAVIQKVRDKLIEEFEIEKNRIKKL